MRALLKLRRERELRRERAGNVRIAIQEAERSGRLVVDAEKICFAFGEHKIIENFSTTIIRGDKVGIIGPNGSGKTTLLKILLGELTPQRGRLRLGTGLKIAYFDQLRAQLDEDRTLKDNIADGNDTVFVDGVPRHIIGYLQDFLFPPAQILAPVRSLSGGERNRLLLAKLFSVPSNVLVLDEPTNDLDTETLELLEERLLDYSGTILLVSHDRAFPEQRRHLDHRLRGRRTSGGICGRIRRLAQPATGARSAGSTEGNGKGGKAQKGERPRRRSANSPSKRHGNWKRCRRPSRPWKRKRRRSSPP